MGNLLGLVLSFVFLLLPTKLAAKWLKAKRSSWKACFWATLLVLILVVVIGVIKFAITVFFPAFHFLGFFVVFTFVEFIFLPAIVYVFILKTGFWRGVGISLVMRVLQLLFAAALGLTLFFAGQTTHIKSILAQLERSQIPSQVLASEVLHTDNTITVEYLAVVADKICVYCEVTSPCAQKMMPQWRRFVEKANLNEFGTGEQERFQKLKEQVNRCVGTTAHPRSSLDGLRLNALQQYNAKRSTSAGFSDKHPAQKPHAKERSQADPVHFKIRFRYEYRTKKRDELKHFKGYLVKVALKEGVNKEGWLDSVTASGFGLREQGHTKANITRVPWEKLEKVQVWVRSDLSSSIDLTS